MVRTPRLRVMLFVRIAGMERPRVEPQVRDLLVQQAVAARRNAHCPYSKYRVGAAIWLGAEYPIVVGANVENASYGLTICAERVAHIRWISDGAPGDLKAVAIAAGPSDEEPTGGRPCGACLQVIREFSADPCVFIVEAGGEVTERRFSDFLPDPFIPGFGPAAQGSES